MHALSMRYNLGNKDILFFFVCFWCSLMRIFGEIWKEKILQIEERYWFLLFFLFSLFSFSHHLQLLDVILRNLTLFFFGNGNKLEM